MPAQPCTNIIYNLFDEHHFFQPLMTSSSSWWIQHLPLKDHAKKRIDAYWRLIRADKPIGTLLLLWPTLWALWLAASGIPPIKFLLIFVIGVFLTRSAGCVINDWADRKVDPNISRTANRPLAVGDITPSSALILFAILMLMAFGLVWLTNPLTIWLAVTAAVLMSVYPLMKRHTHLPQLVLGAAFGMGIPMAFATVQDLQQFTDIPPLAWTLYLANLAWVTGYDTWYAMVDRDEDIQLGVKSTAILLDDADRVGLIVLYGLFFLAMAMVPNRAELGWFYWASLATALGLTVWLFRMGWDRSRDGCFRAFLFNSWVGAVIFVGIVIHYLLTTTPT